MKIAIIGSRTFDDYDFLKKSILENCPLEDIKFVVSGGAVGADFLGEKFAEEHHINKIIIKPNWEKHGRGAGMIRNTEIIRSADVVFAFWDSVSKGTKDSILKARKSGKKLFIFHI
jgi:hypothetical protein